MILADQPLDTLEKKNQRTDTLRGIGTMRKIVEAQHLCKTFNGKAVLNEISFQVKEGEVFGLLGPNGAGKTMMRLSLTEVPLFEIIVSILILLLSVMVMIRLSARIFRIEILMYGKKANLRNILRYLKG